MLAFSKNRTSEGIKEDLACSFLWRDKKKFPGEVHNDKKGGKKKTRDYNWLAAEVCPLKSGKFRHFEQKRIWRECHK